MTTDAKLFPITDIVHALTGAAVGQDKTIPVHLYKHLKGFDQSIRGSFQDLPALRSALKTQLPSALASFSLHDLALIVIELNANFQQDELQDTLVIHLEKKFGKMIVVCPIDKFELESNAMRILRTLTEEPERRDAATDS